MVIISKYVMFISFIYFIFYFALLKSAECHTFQPVDLNLETNCINSLGRI